MCLRVEAWYWLYSLLLLSTSAMIQQQICPEMSVQHPTGFSLLLLCPHPPRTLASVLWESWQSSSLRCAVGECHVSIPCGHPCSPQSRIVLSEAHVPQHPAANPWWKTAQSLTTGSRWLVAPPKAKSRQSVDQWRHLCLTCTPGCTVPQVGNQTAAADPAFCRREIWHSWEGRWTCQLEASSF